MNHDAARQKSSDRRWHYTRFNKRTGTYPIGPCADNCEGHDTAEEAQEHYKEGLLQSALFTDDLPEDQPRNIERCEIEGCEALTTGFGHVGYLRQYSLCRLHRNRASLATLFSIGESWGS